MKRIRSMVFFGTALAAAFVHERSAEAAEPWVDRPQTLHQLVFAGDVGLGVGHADYRRFCNFGDCTGLGMNLEAALGITDHVELGLRTGLRFGDAGRATGADYYGRTLWTQTFETGGDVVANPEVRVRGSVYRGSVAEVGLDGRVVLPFDRGTRLGLVLGVPLAFHVADTVRIDTGVYLPIFFYDPAAVGVSIPADFWFQVTNTVWLGPMTAIRTGDRQGTHLLLGFGLGAQVAQSVDLKTMLIFPSVDDGPGQQFGLGFGAQFRVGD